MNLSCDTCGYEHSFTMANGIVMTAKVDGIPETLDNKVTTGCPNCNKARLHSIISERKQDTNP